MNAQPTLFDKRWRDREERWVRPNRPVFEPSGFGVEAMPGRREATARAFVERHHYSGTYPASRLAVGLFRKDGPCAETRLVGVSVFSVGMPGAIAKHTGLNVREGVECGRFVCLPEVAYNGETWFQARAFDALRAEKPEVRSVVSYADPLERRTAEGQLCKPAHAGTIYRAGNAVYVGRARGGPVYLTRDGKTINRRTITKIQAGDVGAAGGERLLVAAGAEPRRFGEDPRAWLDRVLVEPTFRVLRHPGNLTYVFGLDRQAKQIAAGRAQPLPERRAA